MHRTFIAAAMACATATPALAQDPMEKHLGLLDAYQARQGGKAGPMGEGTLAAGARQVVKLRLEAGAWLAGGVCDDNCGDLDLKVTDASGAVLARNEQLDDMPTVAFTVAAAGEVSIEAFMSACQAATCAFAVRAYAK